MQDSGIFDQTLAIRYEQESLADLQPEDEGKPVAQRQEMVIGTLALLFQ